MGSVRILTAISAIPIFFLLWQAILNASAKNIEAAAVAMLCSLIFLLYLRVARERDYG